MAIAVLVIFWVVVGIGVLLVAMSATKKPKSDDDRGSRAARIALGLGATVLIVVGLIVIPAVIMVDNTDADEKAPGGVKLTKAQTHGRQQFAANCAQCHTMRASNAVGQTGPNLDNLRPPAPLTLNAIEQGRAGGTGQMPAGLLTGQDAKDVASYVQAVAGR